MDAKRVSGLLCFPRKRQSGLCVRGVFFLLALSLIQCGWQGAFAVCVSESGGDVCGFPETRNPLVRSSQSSCLAPAARFFPRAPEALSASWISFNAASRGEGEASVWSSTRRSLREKRRVEAAFGKASRFGGRSLCVLKSSVPFDEETPVRLSRRTPARVSEASGVAERRGEMRLRSDAGHFG